MWWARGCEGVRVFRWCCQDGLDLSSEKVEGEEKYYGDELFKKVSAI